MALSAIDKGAAGTDLYLYFAGANLELKRTVKLAGATDWSNPTTRKGASKVAVGSSLSVVADEANNYVFYIEQGATTVDFFPDAFTSNTA